MKRRAFILLCALLPAAWRARAYDIWGPFIEETGRRAETPEWLITFKILESQPDKTTKKRATVEDVSKDTGKGILFPAVLDTLNAEDLREFRMYVTEWLIRRKTREIADRASGLAER